VNITTGTKNKVVSFLLELLHVPFRRNSEQVQASQHVANMNETHTE
jgi:hypothetical protein